MSFLDTPHKKKSAMLTSIIVLLLLIVFSWIGLSYFDPPISYGIEVNFGTTSHGKGKIPSKNQPKQVEQQEVNAKVEITKTTPKVTEVKAPKVLTQKHPSVPIIKNEAEKISTPKISESKTPTNEVKEEVIQESPKPTVSKSTKQVLSNLFNNSNKSEESSQGEGDDEEVGDKGKIPSVGHLFFVVFNPTIPLSDAGILTDPPVSVPTPHIAISEATAAADPAEDPPQTR